MKIRELLFAVTLCALMRPPAEARPLLTEEVPTVGKKSFEVIVSLSQRDDAFGTPKTNYRTVTFPVSARIGVHRAVDIGFYLNYIKHRIEATNSHFTGSQNGRFSPFVKVSPWKNLGFQAIWHTQSPEQGAQSLPIARGRDIETLMMLKLPVDWPVTFNVGYVFRREYRSKLGVSNGPSYRVQPGDIFESKGAIEIPLKFHLSILGELAYYTSRQNRIEGIPVAGTSAEAMDALIGMTWNFRGWNIGAGAAFGLLDEQHTSFDLERGAGDTLYKATVAYRLVPRAGKQ